MNLIGIWIEIRKMGNDNLLTDHSLQLEHTKPLRSLECFLSWRIHNLINIEIKDCFLFYIVNY